ncbi:MAG: terminase [Oscillospiraceae bacterium]|nr:terminase [Oscillospiraceae bacterium]
MADSRKGRQTPTVSLVLPYTESRGAEAIALYNQSDRETMPWQELMLEDIMAVNDDGLWIHMKFGWSIPRRNGKSELLIMRSIWDLLHGRRTLYTAHRETTSAMAWEKILRLLGKMGYREDDDFKSYKSAGRRSIEWMRDGSEAVINFRTRTASGGLGEGYDTLIIDEAQEYTADQETALKYVVTDSKNPQTLMCGTPPTVVSSGDVFLKLRKRILTGIEEDAGWAEWSVPALTDAHDPALWYETNPSLGYILTERTIRSELGDDQVDDNIQRLGLWLTYSQKSAISRKEWDACLIDGKPEPSEPVRVFYGVKYTKNTGNAVLCAAVRLDDGRIFVEGIDCRPVREGDDWIIAFLRSPGADTAVIDGASGQNILRDAMQDADVQCRALLPKVGQIVTANALFEQSLFAGQICHAGQPSLTQAVTNSEHRAIGASGGYGYATVLEGAEPALLEAAALAHWACANVRDYEEQVITY